MKALAMDAEPSASADDRSESRSQSLGCSPSLGFSPLLCPSQVEADDDKLPALSLSEDAEARQLCGDGLDGIRPAAASAFAKGSKQSAPSSSRENADEQHVSQGLLALRAAMVSRHEELLHSLDELLEARPGPPRKKLSFGRDPTAFRADAGRNQREKVKVRPPRRALSAEAVLTEEKDVPSHPNAVPNDKELVSVLEGSDERQSSAQEEVDSFGIVPAVPSRKSVRSKTAAEHLPSLAVKRRSSWLVTTKARLQDAAKAKNLGGAVKLSRNEKVEARKAGELAHGPGLLSSLHAEYSVTAVQKTALDGLGSEKRGEKLNNWCVRMVKNDWFERVTLVMVLLNAVEMALDVEFNRDEFSFAGVSPFFVVTQNLFCVYFLAELGIRFATYPSIWYILRDSWYLFEGLLALMMAVETWVLPAVHALGVIETGSSKSANSLRFARILRVLRTARLARLVKLTPELLILVKGMVVACRSVFFTLSLLLLITVIFSINFMEFARGTALEGLFFESMGVSIWTLILNCIIPDQQDFVRAVAAENDFLGALVLLFILLGSLTVMNMLLGVLVEAVKTVSIIERENLDAEVARKVLWGMLENDDGAEADERLITKEEFISLLSNKKGAQALASIGVDVAAASDFGRMLFEDEGSILFIDFMSAMLTLRGSNKTTVKDIVELRKFVAEEFSAVQSLVGELCLFLAEHLDPPTVPSRQSPAESVVCLE